MTSTNAASTDTTPKPPNRLRRAATGAPAPLSPARPRRRPGLIGLGLAMVAVVALAVAWLVQTSGDTTAVVAVAREVPAGAVIEATDLRSAEVSADPSLETIPASELGALVGQRAVVSLLPGQTLTRSAVAGTVTPESGSALVGVAVTAAQMPSEPLRGGDTILVVDTPVAQDDPPTAAPASIAATVVSTTAVPDTAQTVINVAVRRDRAQALAARVATGRIAVVLLAPGTAVED